MIKVYEQTPEYYYNSSRDFQLIGRLFEAVFNYVKTGADNVANVPLRKNVDTVLLDLVVATIGFESRNKYDVKNLLALAHSFHTILRKKGTKGAIEDSIRVLLKAQNIQEQATVSIDNKVHDTLEGKYQERMVSIYVPRQLRDIALLEDMLNYILPVGFNYEIIPTTYPGEGYKSVSTLEDVIKRSAPQDDSNLGTVTQGKQELSEDELDNIGKGVVDNLVVVKQEQEE